MWRVLFGFFPRAQGLKYVSFPTPHAADARAWPCDLGSSWLLTSIAGAGDEGGTVTRDTPVEFARFHRERDGRHGVARPPRPTAVYWLLALLLLLAINALGGGGALVAVPSGALLGMPVELLAGSPFGDYLLPGALLFGLLGMFPLVVAWGLWQRPSWAYLNRVGVDGAWLGAVLVGVALIIWILVQMTILRFFLQPVLLALGAAIVGVSLLPAVRRYYAQPEKAKEVTR